MKYFLSRFHALHKIVERKLMKLFSVNSMFLIFHCPEETSKTRRDTTNISITPTNSSTSTNTVIHHPLAFCLSLMSDCRSSADVLVAGSLIFCSFCCLLSPLSSLLSAVPSPFCIICWLVSSTVRVEY